MNISTRATVLWGGSAAFNIAMLGWWAQPETISALMQGLQFSESTAGMVISVELLAVAFASFAFSVKVSQVPIRRYAYIAVVGAIVLHFISMFIPDLMWLLCVRLGAGLCEGFLLAVATASVAATPDPDRSYGILNTSNVIYCGLFLALAPLLTEPFQHVGIFGALLIACLLLLPLIGKLPARIAVQTPPADLNKRVSAILLIVAMIIWGTVVAVPWAFLVSLGERTALNGHQIGLVAAFSGFGGFLGGILSAKVGRRIDRRILIFMGMLANMMTGLWLTHTNNSVAYIFAAPMFIGCLYFIYPYFLGLAADIDPKGGCPAAIGATFIMTGGTGPLFGGYLVESAGLEAVGWAIVVGCMASYLVLYYLLVGGRVAQQTVKVGRGEITSH